MRSDHERTEPSSIERTDAGQYRTGTTIVGVRAEEGVVFAAANPPIVADRARQYREAPRRRRPDGNRDRGPRRRRPPAGRLRALAEGSRETVTAAGMDVAALDSGGFELFGRDRRERLLDEAGLRQGS